MRNISNTKVAVIGGAGFLGSHLVNYLIEEKNCEVFVLDNLISGFKKYIHPKATFIYCDITASEFALYKILKENEIDYIFNYSAEPYIPVSFERPIHTFNINAVGALKVMNAGQDAGVKGILQVSSAEIYGEAKGKVNEDEPVIPHSTYGAGKAVIDSLVQIRWKEAQTPAIAMRQFNCVGERETHPYIIPEIISQVSKLPEHNGNVYLGNNSFRDFQYAGDAVRMAVELLEKGNFGEVYNMGSETGIKMYDLAETIGKLMGKEVTVITDQARVRPWEIWHLQSDNTKLYSVIDYRRKTTLEEALAYTIADFINNGSKWDF
jgi:nucleoside-diphosphate-sugar epimerase